MNGKDTSRYQQMIQCVTKASTDHRVTYLHEFYVVKWCDPADHAFLINVSEWFAVFGCFGSVRKCLNS